MVPVLVAVSYKVTSAFSSRRVFIPLNNRRLTVSLTALLCPPVGSEQGVYLMSTKQDIKVLK